MKGDVFKGSHRSGQFLQYIVDQAIAGHFESLKERVIGMELFGRSASYDTGDDAIVRVTASDVRKRLLQHYGRYGATSGIRINLPSGTYIPEITRDPHGESGLFDGALANGETGQVRHDSPGPDVGSVPAPAGSGIETSALTPGRSQHNPRFARWVPMVVLRFLILAMNLALWGLFWSRPSPLETPHLSPLPWSALFGSSHGIELITSDPNIAEIQGITGSQVSVSDYANHNYVPVPNKLTPEQSYFCRSIPARG